MLAGVLRLFGGYALGRRELRLLYISVFLSFLGTSIIFPLRLLYAQAHHATPAQLGLMAASFLLAPLLAQLPMGWAIDHWGRVPLLLVGLVSHVLISVCYIVFNMPLELIALRFLEGVSISAVRPAISAYIADVTPVEHRSEAYGVLGAALSAGLLIGPLVGGLIGQTAGFTTAFAVNIGVEAVAALLVWGRVHEPVVHATPAGGGQGRVKSWRALVSLPLIGAYAAFFCGQIVMGVLSSLWTIWVHDLGGSYTYIGATYTVFALPQIFFGAIAGRLGDRWGRAPVLLIAGVLLGVIYAAYGFITDLTLIVLLGIVEGFFLIFQQPAAQGFLADASPPDARGRAQGISGAIGAVGGAVAAFVSLPLYHYSRALPFVLAGVSVVAGSLVASTSAVVLARRRSVDSVEAVASAAR